MVNQQVLEAHWNEIQGKLRDRWGELTDDDMQQVKGSAQQLVGMIQRKTGEAREQIESVLEDFAHGSATSVDEAAATVRDYAQQAVDKASQYAGQMSDSVQSATTLAADTARAGYDSTERLVHRRPVESLLVCFGVGIVTGVVVSLIMRSK